jgi:hypothetical protein
MSITLTTPYTVSVKGVQVENDTIGACVSMSMDYLARMLTYVFEVGALTGSPSNLNAGPYALQQGQTITVMVYVGPTTATQTFGQWYLNGALQGAIIAAATLNPIVTQLLSNRNTSEGFVAVVGGLMPGSTVAWTQL